MTYLCKTIVGIFRSFGFKLPDGEYKIRRTYASCNQLSSGSLRWTLERIDRKYIGEYGGWERASDLVKAWRYNPTSVEVNDYHENDVRALETK
jgi:hypothetical protein